jgi:uncharacterized protein YkwD
MTRAETQGEQSSMNRSSARRALRTVILIAGLATGAIAQGGPLSAVQVLREGGCGGIVPAARPLYHNELLDQAAQQAAIGRGNANYGGSAVVHVRGPQSAMLELLRRADCRSLADRAMTQIGVYQQGSDTWLVLGAARGAAAAALARPVSVSPPPRMAAAPAAPVSASRALELVNEVRARGTRCGEHSFAPAPPLQLSGTLAGVASGHALDMAEHNYFEHEDLTGHTPADRVRAVGYREKLVGENIAYGPTSTEEVVQGWLASPGHCENIMDPRFAEMGIADAAGQGARRGLFWVQLLAAPRS